MKLLTAPSLGLQVNIKSLEDVVRAYLKLAEEKTETAKEESQQMVLDIEDLDNIQTPERYRKLKAHTVPSYSCLDGFLLLFSLLVFINFFPISEFYYILLYADSTCSVWLFLVFIRNLQTSSLK